MTEKAAKAKRQRKEHEWIVLEYVTREHVEVPDGDDLPAIEAWRVIGVHVSNTRGEAINAIVGDREGRFKAVAAPAWKGGVARTKEVAVVSSRIDD